jgi:hypothetical protein
MPRTFLDCRESFMSGTNDLGRPTARWLLAELPAIMPDKSTELVIIAGDGLVTDAKLQLEVDGYKIQVICVGPSDRFLDGSGRRGWWSAAFGVSPEKAEDDVWVCG